MIKVNLFSQILANISREKFDTLVKKHQSDKQNKGLKSWTHLVSMLFCHIGGACLGISLKLATYSAFNLFTIKDILD